MKKDHVAAPITLDIVSLSHDGRGIASVNGKTTFVSGALPNEKVLCKLTKKHARYNEATAIEILIPAPERTSPLCAHFSKCGGCAMQHLEINTQIKLKEKTLLEQLKHFGKVVPETVIAPLSGNQWNYRRKARLGVRYDRHKGKLVVGFREKSSNYLTNIQTCQVLDASIGMKIASLSELIQSLSQFEHISQIEVAVGDHATALIFRHLTPLSADDLQKMCHYAATHNLHFYLQPNPPEKIHKIWPKNSSELLSYSLPDYQLEMQFHPLDFIQVNGEVNRLLLNKAIELLAPNASDTILDLFSGLGNFTLPLARFARHVTGIEAGNEMVTRAQQNALHNGIQNVEFYAANLQAPSSANWLTKKYDKILLDPPRTGAKEILPYFPRFAAKKVVYVSCNPATLARDAGELVYNYGYKLKQVGVVNMFPHTNHIEAIALFEK